MNSHKSEIRAGKPASFSSASCIHKPHDTAEHTVRCTIATDT
jgi:hypothetical protein